MFYHAENKQIQIEDTTIDYVVFGQGEPLVLIAGLGDGLRSMKGLALPIAFMYHVYAKKYRVYVFSRRNKMKENFTTKDMAEDLLYCMAQVGIQQAHFIGVSQGGMLAQWCAILKPECVKKLVLVVTCSKASKEIKHVIPRWKTMCEEDYTLFMQDNLKYMYSDAYNKKNMWMTKFVAKFTKPTSFTRFKIMADACVTHDAYEHLHNIKADTFIIGGEKDLTVGVEESYVLHEKIKNSKLHIYKEWGHALYEEAKDFNTRVLHFLDN